MCMYVYNVYLNGWRDDPGAGLLIGTIVERCCRSCSAFRIGSHCSSFPSENCLMRDSCASYSPAYQTTRQKERAGGIAASYWLMKSPGGVGLRGGSLIPASRLRNLLMAAIKPQVPILLSGRPAASRTLPLTALLRAE